MNYLIIGGASAAGQSCIEAIRASDSEARIFATTSKDKGEIDGADTVIYGIDLSQQDAVEKTIAALPSGEQWKLLIYTPAFGAIGFPVEETKAEDLKKSMAFCVDPMVALQKKLQPELTIGFSAFYFKPHLLGFYGAMAFVKLEMEKLALESPEKYKMIRAGSFVSKATRGISILLQRQMKKTKFPQLLKLGDEWRAKGGKFSDFFFEFIDRSEAQAYGDKFDQPHRTTNGADLSRAMNQILEGEKAPIVNVLGDWLWTESSLPDLPRELLVELK